MQSAEKVTPRFMLKLALLFILLLSGWMLKVPKPARSVSAPASKNQLLPAAAKQDSQQAPPFYFHLVKLKEVSAAF